MQSVDFLREGAVCLVVSQSVDWFTIVSQGFATSVAKLCTARGSLRRTLGLALRFGLGPHLLQTPLLKLGLRGSLPAPTMLSTYGEC